MPVSFETIGAEAQPLVILDDFARDPGVLRDYAMGARFEPALNHYPGGRAALPEAYLAAQLPAIAAVAQQAFGRAGAGPADDHCLPVDRLSRCFAIDSSITLWLWDYS